MTDDVAYLSVELILELHEQIVAEGDTTEPGVRSEDAGASTLQYITEGFFEEVPETIHEKAVHLMRLLIAEHPFVDGNKRTALRTVVALYLLPDVRSSQLTYGPTEYVRQRDGVQHRFL